MGQAESVGWYSQKANGGVEWAERDKRKGTLRDNFCFSDLQKQQERFQLDPRNVYEMQIPFFRTILGIGFWRFGPKTGQGAL